MLNHSKDEWLFTSGTILYLLLLQCSALLLACHLCNKERAQLWERNSSLDLMFILLLKCIVGTYRSHPEEIFILVHLLIQVEN